MKYYLFVFLSVLLFLGCQEKKIDLDGVWVNDVDDRYYFYSDTVFYHNNSMENRHWDYLFEISRNKLIVKDVTDSKTLGKAKFEVLDSNTISLGFDNEKMIDYRRVIQPSYIDYQLNQREININLLSDEPGRLIGDLYKNYYENRIIATVDEDDTILFNSEVIYIDSVFVEMKDFLDGLGKWNNYRWKEKTLLVLDREISFYTYNLIRKQLLKVEFFNNTKINHLYENIEILKNKKKNPCRSDFMNHSISRHCLLFSKKEWREHIAKQPWTIEEDSSSVLNKISIFISKNDEVLIDNNKVEDTEITNFLYSKYIYNPKKTIFIINPSPKSTYGKYLFTRNRILDCVNKAKQEYPIGEYGNFPFDLERWQKDSLNQLFPLYEELGEFKN